MNTFVMKIVSLCCLPESFKDYHLNIDENGDGVISQEELEKAKKIVEKADEQKKNTELQGFMNKL